MTAVIGIHLVGLVVCLLPGLALVSLLRPQGRWAVHWALPLGMATLIVVMYPLSYLAPAGLVGPGVVGASALIVALASWRRLRAGREHLTSAWRPTRLDLVAAGLGGVASLAALSPLLRLGFPTTVAFTNNDAWYYSGLVNWLSGNRASDTIGEVSVNQPLQSVVGMYQDPSLAFGFELYAATVHALTTLDAHQVVGAAAAVGLPVAVSGWVALCQSFGGRCTWLTVTMASVAALTPGLLFGLTETYLTQFIGLAVMPIALAALVMLARMPDWRHLLVAAIGCGAVLGIYPGMLPWMGLMGLVVLAVVPGPWPAPLTTPAAATASARLLRPLLIGLALLVAVMAVAAIPLIRALRFATLASGYSDLSPWPDRTTIDQLALVAGSLDHPLLPGSTATTLGVVGLGVAVLLAAILGGRTTWTILAIGAAAAAATAIVLWSYRDFNYGYYRALVTASALLGGCLVVALACVPRPNRSRIVACGVVLLCALIWQSGARTQLGTQYHAEPGFRDREFALQDQLQALPEGSVVLVDGADLGGVTGTTWYQSQLRMMTAYFASLHDNFVAEGLWSTPTYYSDGPLEEYRPTRAWTHVLMARAPTFHAGRQQMWEREPFTLSEAPAMDLAEYGPGWHGFEHDGTEPYRWTHGPFEVLVSNRHRTARQVWVSLRATSLDVPRTLAAIGADGESHHRISPTRSSCLVKPVEIPAGGVSTLWMNADPPAASPNNGDPRLLALRIDRVRYSEDRPGPRDCLRDAALPEPPPEAANQ